MVQLGRLLRHVLHLSPNAFLETFGRRFCLEPGNGPPVTGFPLMSLIAITFTCDDAPRPASGYPRASTLSVSACVLRDEMDFVAGKGVIAWILWLQGFPILILHSDVLVKKLDSGTSGQTPGQYLNNFYAFAFAPIKCFPFHGCCGHVLLRPVEHSYFCL